MKRLLLPVVAVLFFASCGGPSHVSAEVVPMDKVCSYEKWKTVAVEGYLAPQTMSCERGRKGGVLWCSFRVYANTSLTGTNISVQIPIASLINGKNNRMDDPPSRAEDLHIYDNDGNPIPPESKIRVYGTLPKSSVCEFGLVDRIDRVS
jgi:hypothetical protein